MQNYECGKRHRQKQLFESFDGCKCQPDNCFVFVFAVLQSRVYSGGEKCKSAYGDDKLVMSDRD
jgi:hypothetical protein